MASRGLHSGTLGNASPSSLVSASNAQYNKLQNFQDKAVLDNFQNSLQTADDYNALKEHFTGRLNTVTDPTHALSIKKTIEGARKSYVSNEIQRASIAVQEGNGTPEDKLNAIRNFYQQAVQNGDMNQAQNLEQQYNSGVIALQNQQAAAVAHGQAVAKENNRILAENNLQSHNDAIQAVQATKDYIDQVFKDKGQAGIKALAKDPAFKDLFVDESGKAVTPDLYTARASILRSKLNLENGFSQDGSLSVAERNRYVKDAQATYGDLQKAIPLAQAVANGQEPKGQSVTIGPDGKAVYSEKDNPIVGILRMKGPDGSYITVPQYDTNGVHPKDDANYKGLYQSLKNSKEAQQAGVTFDKEGNPTLHYVDGNGEKVRDVALTPHGNGFVFADPTSPTGLGILRNVNGQYKTTVEPLPADEANSDNFNLADQQFQVAQAQTAHDNSLPVQAGKVLGGAGHALGQLAGGVLNPASVLDFATHGLQAQQQAKQAADLKASLQAAQQIHQQSATALAALPHLNAPVPTYDASLGRMNGPGALQVPAATVKAANTAGTPEFSQRFGFPAPLGNITAPAAKAPATPAPASKPGAFGQVINGAVGAAKAAAGLFGFHF